MNDYLNNSRSDTIPSLPQSPRLEPLPIEDVMDDVEPPSLPPRQAQPLHSSKERTPRRRQHSQLTETFECSPAPPLPPRGLCASPPPLPSRPSSSLPDVPAARRSVIREASDAVLLPPKRTRRPTQCRTCLYPDHSSQNHQHPQSNHCNVSYSAGSQPCTNIH